MLNSRKKITLIVSATAIMISALGAGFASAQEADPQPPITQERSNPLMDYMTGLGITAEDVAAADEAGLSWREFIEANGGSVDEVSALMLAQAQERFDEMLDRPVRSPRQRAEGIRRNLQELVDITGIDAETLRAGLQSGTPLADILASNGIDLQTVTDAIVANRTDAINEAVANGRLTQEQADERIAGLSDAVSEFLTSTPDLQALRDRFQDHRDGRGNRGNRGPGGNPGFGAPDAPAEATPEVGSSS